jgi:hypothetical protein
LGTAVFVLELADSSVVEVMDCVRACCTAVVLVARLVWVATTPTKATTTRAPSRKAKAADHKPALFMLEGDKLTHLDITDIVRAMITEDRHSDEHPVALEHSVSLV